jgi:hypothetical protein
MLYSAVALKLFLNELGWWEEGLVKIIEEMCGVYKRQKIEEWFIDLLYFSICDNSDNSYAGSAIENGLFQEHKRYLESKEGIILVGSMAKRWGVVSNGNDYFERTDWITTVGIEIEECTVIIWKLTYLPIIQSGTNEMVEIIIPNENKKKSYIHSGLFVSALCNYKMLYPICSTDPLHEATHRQYYQNYKNQALVSADDCNQPFCAT